VFLLHFPLLHVYSVAENTMEINHTGKLIFFIRGARPQWYHRGKDYLLYTCVFSMT
jgi:hypothetical protein